MEKRAVTAAVITDEEGRVMLCRRPEGKRLGGMWEFPGGKLEEGETLPVCLVRECREELDITVRTGRELAAIEAGEFIIHYIECSIAEGEPVLCEHSAIAWLLPSEIKPDELCPADAELAVKYLIK